ncbi:MAG: hypothetical protein Q9204_007625, partial [Flavoplaca sp. TL-2023a]
EPPFTFPTSYARKGHRYMVWLANANGDFETRTESTQVYPLTLVAWDNNRSFWTVDVGHGRWIIASVCSKLRIPGMPQSQWPVPYRRWLGTDMSETGFSTAYVAYWTPAKPTDSSRPSGITAAATTKNDGSRSQRGTSTLQPLARAPAAGAARGLSWMANAPSQQPITGAIPMSRKRSQHSGGIAARKKVKMSAASVPSASGDTQQDTRKVIGYNLTPSKTRWKSGRTSTISTASRETTPDTSPSFERLTPPRAYNHTNSNNGQHPAGPATNQWTVTGHSNQQSNYVQSMGTANTTHNPFSNRMFHNQESPNFSGPLFKELPNIPTHERPTRETNGSASLLIRRPALNVLSQDTEAKKEQLAELKDIEDEEKRLGTGSRN